MLSPIVLWWKKMCFRGSNLLTWSAASKHRGTWQAEAGEFLSSRLAWASCQAPCPPGLHTLTPISKTNRPVWVLYVCNLRDCGIESVGLSWVQDYIVNTRPAGDTKHDTVSNDKQQTRTNVLLGNHDLWALEIDTCLNWVCWNNT